jgi:hypothetical protein
MFDLIEIELTRVRRMAEQTSDGFLLYLLDMAILEANRRSRSRSAVLDDLAVPAMVAEASMVAELKVVR